MASSSQVFSNSNSRFNSNLHTYSDSTASTANTSDEDFPNMDITSSLQTSTDSPEHSDTNNSKTPDISGLKFFTQKMNTLNQGNDMHTRFIRKSLVISPSWNNVKSSQYNDETPTGDLSFDLNTEEPTSALGISISPSIKQLSDILNQKVNTEAYGLSKITEENEHEPTTSLIDDIYGTHYLKNKRSQSVATLITSNTVLTTNSNDTLQLTNTTSLNAPNEPDLIDLASPQEANSEEFINEVTTTNESYQSGPLKINGSSLSSSLRNHLQYTDILETYSPERNPSSKIFNERVSTKVGYPENRTSILSEQLTLADIPSPEFPTNEEIQDFSSFHEIGYDDSEESGFSFVPSFASKKAASSKNIPLELPFEHPQSHRLSLRFVEANSDVSLSNDEYYPASSDATPVVDANTPVFVNNEKMNSVLVPNLKSAGELIQPSGSSLLNAHPIRNSSPTIEKLNMDSQVQQEDFSAHQESSKVELPKKDTKNAVKPMTKTKKNKLTFKGLFKKDPLVQPNDGITVDRKVKMEQSRARPNSFSFNFETRKVDKAERKEKSKSLLSLWKRKSNSTVSKRDTVAENITETNNFSASSPMANLKPLPQSPQYHSNVTPVVKEIEKTLPILPPPQSDSLLASYGLDKTPVTTSSPIFLSNRDMVDSYQISDHSKTNQDKDFNHTPQINRASSYQTFETSHTAEIQNPQSAVVTVTSPFQIQDDSMEKIVDVSAYSNGTFSGMTTMNESDLPNTSSAYASVNAENSNDFNEKDYSFTPQQNDISFDFDTTPIVPSHGAFTNQEPHTPATINVQSFTESPNKFHIGDDLFPKHLGLTEIESIVSLERSRSMRSMRSQRVNSLNRSSETTKTIMQIVNDNKSFDELQLEDGSVVIRSPSIQKNSDQTFGKKTSILRPKTTADHASQVSSKLKDEIDLEEDLSDMINMINFGDGDETFDTNFDIDTTLGVQLSPIKAVSPSKSALKKDGSVPDFLSIDTEYMENFDDYVDYESPMASKLSLQFNNSPIEFIDNSYSEPKPRQVSRESIENIIAQEERFSKPSFSTDSHFDGSSDFYNDNEPLYSENAFIPLQPDNRISMSFKGLKGPTFNTLKPSTKTAIMDSLNDQRPVSHILPSDSENSISNMIDTYDEYTKYNEDEIEISLNKEFSFSDSDHVEFSSNNPFTENSHDYLENYSVGSTTTLDAEFNNQKSASFMKKVNDNQFGHFSTSSLSTQVQQTSDKPKMLNRGRTKSSLSFTKLFGSKEIEKPRVQFSSRILLYDTYAEDEYDRQPEQATCNNLTPQLAMEIKAELNELKSEMDIHELSRCYTHFF